MNYSNGSIQGERLLAIYFRSSMAAAQTGLRHSSVLTFSHISVAHRPEATGASPPPHPLPTNAMTFFQAKTTRESF